jgi:hypothetical protein
MHRVSRSRQRRHSNGRRAADQPRSDYQRVCGTWNEEDDAAGTSSGRDGTHEGDTRRSCRATAGWGRERQANMMGDLSLSLYRATKGRRLERVLA